MIQKPANWNEINENVPGYWCPLLKPDEKGRIVNPETGEVLQT